jgi:hypothetical protein
LRIEREDQTGDGACATAHVVVAEAIQGLPQRMKSFVALAHLTQHVRQPHEGWTRRFDRCRFAQSEHRLPRLALAQEARSATA